MQPFGIRERDASNTRAVTAGIDSNNKFADALVVIIFIVEPLHYLNCFRIFQKGVHHLKACGQRVSEIQLLVKSNDVLSESFFQEKRNLGAGAI